MELLSVDRLRCYDVVVIAVVMLVVDVAMALWSRQGTQLSLEEVVLLKKYNEQVQIVNRLKSVETFVEQSKAIRKMNAIKKQMQELAVERMQKAAPSVLQKRIDQFRTPALMGFFMFYYWNEPLAVLPQGYMLPIERLVSFPGFPLGAISAVGWAAICRRVGTKLLA
ncbi:hypothetical protein Poli38472_001562 [Pythium oligandrum]|uniref:Guided entry of tail-anchored proteins factor 1 n=1 Tax=Pythium oligandrum TaxID=41045 RepID=A0A8K1FNH8_PYTOL|nr:hypothetical protein Poli38472_001562 [Pythium oligandrum]|eukprot:TMW69406.1 hypothetical protein Poli38472_001562 [Pythium oligandrum]